MKFNKNLVVSAITLCLLCSAINTAVATDAKVDKLVAQSVKLYENGQYKEALKPLRQYLNQHPENTEALTLMGIIHGTTGDSNKAIVYFKKVTELTPNDWKPYSLIANTYKQKGMYHLAVEYFNKGLKVPVIDDNAKSYLNAQLDKVQKELKASLDPKN